MRTFLRFTPWGLVLAVSSFPLAANAQPAPTQPVTPQAGPTQPAPAPQGGAERPPQQPGSLAAPAMQIPVEPGGLTADAVGMRARKTSFTAKAQEENLRAAAARVDQAWVQYLPRLSGLASYTRLSNFTPPSLTTGGSTGGLLLGVSQTPGGNVVTQLPNGAPAPFDPATQQIIYAPANLFSFPIVLDNWLLQGTITVPITDYFLRISENYTAALSSEDAARYDFAAAGAKAEADGKVAFYTWLRAKGAVYVAQQSLEDQKTHLTDAKNQFQVGNASKADVLRAETGVASAELAVERSKNLEDLSLVQVKIAIHARDEEMAKNGEDVSPPSPPVALTLTQAVQEAQTSRLEIKSLAANAEVLRQQIKAARAGYYPSVSAFADGIYANPNQRRFPQHDEWFPTWDVGARLTWSPNDVLTARAGAGDVEGRLASIEASQKATSDGIAIEVTQAWQAVKEADFAIETTARQVTSATEAYRVASELYKAGRATSTILTDAETDLVRARLEYLNAHVDARIARVRLDHALGRDAHIPPPPQH
jgi:outer membrane protein TolC